jgi:hypothetical protein
MALASPPIAARRSGRVVDGSENSNGLVFDPGRLATSKLICTGTEQKNLTVDPTGITTTATAATIAVLGGDMTAATYSTDSSI